MILLFANMNKTVENYKAMWINIVKITTTIDEINAASDPEYYRLLKFYVLASMLMFVFCLLLGDFLLTGGFVLVMILAASIVR